ncbi:hypothetical protein ALI144C_23325 [Actinosynnema sp. ALI-1.44]|uniref:hypothetical protein n=1 Tax=Actinosynnema sp. ALI-1.44 TaxID=1933779 RepID=UPI00097C929B|nr:hypothetical protein [Actinosynnema sp. ALI-1.44]ONI79697.1 hypothetical protein ALI144C_23325 [Actinosynnema sp. ALI-1.44]
MPNLVLRLTVGFVVFSGALVTTIAPPLWDKYSNLWDFPSNFRYSAEWLLLGVLAWLVCVGAGGRGVVPPR